MDNMNKDNLNKLINDDELRVKVEALIKSELDIFASSFNNVFFSEAIIGEKVEIKYSSSIESVTGYSAKDIEELPNKLASIMHEDDRLRVKNFMNDFLSGNIGEEASVSYRIISKDEKEIYLNEKLKAKFNNNKIVAYQSVIIDISDIRNERKDIEIINESLIRLDKMKDKFISIISHDLKSPYTTILGFSEILMNDDSLHEKERNEYISYIYDGAKLQLNLIEHLLDWSRLRTGRTKIENQRLDLRNLISTVVSKLTGLTVRKNIEISQNIPLNLFINSDEIQLSKAISDVISNAIKYSYQNSKISISADRFKGGMIEIVIKDNGVGIAKEDQEKLFKLDQKFSRKGTDGEAGSGMGLIVVNEIIDKLRGDIWFYSTEGEGSEFHITIPEAKNQILLVNPLQDYINEKSEIISVKIPNYQILKALNGFEALEYIEEELPTVVITADEMPMMNGTELIKLIRNKDKYFSVSIIVLASEVNDDIKRRYETHIVDHILESKISDNELIHTINRLLK